MTGHRPLWNVEARGWNRKPGLVVISLDPERPEVTLRTPPGEMAGMTDREVGELIEALHKARVELRARQ